jgi:predicted amidophosphoribosyltransferase
VLARRSGAAYEPHLLAKTRRTPAQADLTPTQRRANLRNAFACLGVQLRGANILLVDDVLTTGTTAHRASIELRRVGAGRILVAVAARGIGRRP